MLASSVEITGKRFHVSDWLVAARSRLAALVLPSVKGQRRHIELKPLNIPATFTRTRLARLQGGGGLFAAALAANEADALARWERLRRTAAVIDAGAGRTQPRSRRALAGCRHSNRQAGGSELIPGQGDKMPNNASGALWVRVRVRIRVERARVQSPARV